MKVLILGGAGQDAKYLSEILKRENGFEVSLICQNIPDKDQRNHVSDVRYMKQDITALSHVEEILKVVKPDVIVNFASISSVIACEENSSLSKKVNEQTPIELMKLLRKPGFRSIRFIQASSSEMYAKSAERYISELTPTSPNNEYGRQKANVHSFILEEQKGNPNLSSLILFNHESPLRSPAFVSKKIVSAIYQISQGKKLKLSLGNIMSTRDWGFAGDYMDAVALHIKDDRNENYVIASGQLNSIEDFCQIAFAQLGITNFLEHIEVDESLVRANDSIGLRGNSEKIYNYLGWKPKYSFESLVKGLLIAESTGSLELMEGND
jgi:GDPmannose 4,6-dehydratase